MEDAVDSIKQLVASKRNVRGIVEKLRVLSAYGPIDLFTTLLGALQLLKADKKAGEENKAIRNVYEYLSCLLVNDMLDEAAAMTLIHQFTRIDLQEELVPRRLAALQLYAAVAAEFPAADTQAGFASAIQPLLADAAAACLEDASGGTMRADSSKGSRKAHEASIATAPGVYGALAAAAGTAVQPHAAILDHLRPALICSSADVSTSASIALFRAAMRATDASAAAADMARYQDSVKQHVQATEMLQQRTASSSLAAQAGGAVGGGKGSAPSKPSSLFARNPFMMGKATTSNEKIEAPAPVAPVTLVQLQQLLVDAAPSPWPTAACASGTTAGYTLQQQQRYPSSPGRPVPGRSRMGVSRLGSFDNRGGDILVRSDSSSTTGTGAGSSSSRMRGNSGFGAGAPATPQKQSNQRVSGQAASAATSAAASSPSRPCFTAVEEEACIHLLRAAAALANIPLHALVTGARSGPGDGVRQPFKGDGPDDSDGIVCIPTLDPLLLAGGATTGASEALLDGGDSGGSDTLAGIQRLRGCTTGAAGASGQQATASAAPAPSSFSASAGSPLLLRIPTHLQYPPTPPSPSLPPAFTLGHRLQSQCYNVLVDAITNDGRARVQLECAKLLSAGGIPRMLQCERRGGIDVFSTVASAIVGCIHSAVGSKSQPLLSSSLRAAIALGSAYSAWEARMIQRLRRRWNASLAQLQQRQRPDSSGGSSSNKPWRDGGYGMHVGRPGARPSIDTPQSLLRQRDNSGAVGMLLSGDDQADVDMVVDDADVDQQHGSSADGLLPPYLLAFWSSASSTMCDLIDAVAAAVSACDTAPSNRGYQATVGIALHALVWCCPALAQSIPIGRNPVSDPDAAPLFLSRLAGLRLPPKNHAAMENAVSLTRSLLPSVAECEHARLASWATNAMLSDACERVEQRTLHCLLLSISDRALVYALRSPAATGVNAATSSAAAVAAPYSGSPMLQLASLPLVWLHRSMGWCRETASGYHGIGGTTVATPLGQDPSALKNDSRSIRLPAETAPVSMSVDAILRQPSSIQQQRSDRSMHTGLQSPVNAARTTSEASVHGGTAGVSATFSSSSSPWAVIAAEAVAAASDPALSRGAALRMMLMRSKRSSMASGSAALAIHAVPLLQSAAGHQMIVASWHVLRCLQAAGCAQAGKTLRAAVQCALVSTQPPEPFPISGALYVAAIQHIDALRRNVAYARLSVALSTGALPANITASALNSAVASAAGTSTPVASSMTSSATTSSGKRIPHASYGIFSGRVVQLALPDAGPGLVVGGYQYSLVTGSRHQLAHRLVHTAAWWHRALGHSDRGAGGNAAVALRGLPAVFKRPVSISRGGGGGGRDLPEIDTDAVVPGASAATALGTLVPSSGVSPRKKRAIGLARCSASDSTSGAGDGVHAVLLALLAKATGQDKPQPKAIVRVLGPQQQGAVGTSPKAATSSASALSGAGKKVSFKVDDQQHRYHRLGDMMLMPGDTAGSTCASHGRHIEYRAACAAALVLIAA